MQVIVAETCWNHQQFFGHLWPLTAHSGLNFLPPAIRFFPAAVFEVGQLLQFQTSKWQHCDSTDGFLGPRMPQLQAFFLVSLISCVIDGEFGLTIKTCSPFSLDFTSAILCSWEQNITQPGGGPTFCSAATRGWNIYTVKSNPWTLRILRVPCHTLTHSEKTKDYLLKKKQLSPHQTKSA